MIPTTVRRKNVPAWQRALSSAISDPEELVSMLGIDPDLVRQRVAAARRFPLRVPRAYAERMQHGDPDDPLLLQVLPRPAEDTDVAGFVPDPVGDRASMTRPGLLHKYHGRVLLVTTGACGIHCRYCFRRHFPYGEANPRTDQWSGALAYIAADASIREVILSGGDPLSLPDATLATLVSKLGAIEHVETVRVHTRMPVVLPQRVDAALTQWVAEARPACVFVLHANHPREIDTRVEAAGRRLRDAGAILLNQAVLLRDVNDNAPALAELSRRLFAFGALPYYLHLLDPVQGASHFEVPERTGRRLVTELARTLPGYLVPRLVREQPGAPGKTPIGFSWDTENPLRDEPKSTEA